jgi:hypothetical protein
MGLNGTNGQNFQINGIGDLTNFTVYSIIANFSSLGVNFYYFLVLVDERTNFSNPVGLPGNVTGHLIGYNGATWFDFGQFSGIAGPQGEQGLYAQFHFFRL